MRRHPIKIGVQTLLDLLGGERGIWVPFLPHFSSALAKVGGRELLRLLPGFLTRSRMIRRTRIS
jgi:hypothetical protein